MTVGARGAPSRWWDGRTLRWRLVAGLLALLVLTCTVTGVTTTLALRAFLLERLDSQLAQGQVIGDVAQGMERVATPPGAGGEASGAPALDGDGGGNGDGDGDGDGGPAWAGRDGPDDDDDGGGAGLAGALGARLLGGDVSEAVVLRRGDGLAVVPTRPSLDAADRTALAALSTSGRPSTLALDAGTYRARAVPSRGGVLVVGLPTDGVRVTTGRLVAIEAVVFSVVIALGGLAGTVLVRVSLRPLRRVAAAAGAVAATSMASGDVVMPAGVEQTDERTEVGQVGAAFNLMLARVGGAFSERQATEERLRRFVADASHELRTPLAAIRGHSELAGRRAEDLPPDVAHALARVHSESLRMGGLVDDLLLLARLDAGRPLAREDVDLTRLALDATSDARAADHDPRDGGGAAADHRWRLELPEHPVVVTGDVHRLHQVLANLLANARTHTPAGTEVTVSLRTAGDRAEVLVSDDGPGVPEEVTGTVFDRFVRADTSRTRGRGTGSSGLGLAIVAAVTAAHGGTVGLTSRPGLTSFSVRLPLPGAPVGRAPTCDGAPADGSVGVR